MSISPSPYSLLMLGGIAVSIAFWVRLAKRDERLLVIYIAALVSALLGAKIVYLAAEGWMFWDAPERWMIWATGKTILGALLGGYAGVEVAKKLTGYTEATGDWFAVIAPVGIVLGRVSVCCMGAVWERNARLRGGRSMTRAVWRDGRQCRWRSGSMWRRSLCSWVFAGGGCWGGSTFIFISWRMARSVSRTNSCVRRRGLAEAFPATKSRR